MPADSPSSSVSERASLGQRLRTAREERGISLHDIAQRTKIAVSSLEALEHDNPSRLPSGIFARSFVRAYAVEVGLDPDLTLREFLRRFPEHAPPGSEPESEAGAEPSHGSRSGRVLVVLGVMTVLVAIGAGGYWWWQQQAQARSAANAAPGLAAVAQPPAPSPVRPAEPSTLESGAAVTGGEATDAPATPVSDVAAPGGTTGAPPPPAQPGTTPAATGPTQPVQSAPPAGALRIEVHPTGPCWVRLEVDGRVVLERLVQPGERIVRDAGSAVRLQVGDAGAFAFTLNGQAGRSLGAAGRVARADITPDNATTFVVR